MSPTQFVDQCLDLAGPIEASEDTRRTLEEFAEEDGPLTFGDETARSESEERIGRMLQLVVSSPEYQFA